MLGHALWVTVAHRIRRHLSELVAIAPRRPPGSPANRRATDYVAGRLVACGLPITALPIRASYWQPGTAQLTVDGFDVPLTPPPFCRTTRAHGRVMIAQNLADLEAAGQSDPTIIVLRGGMAQPYFPKAFPFVSFPDQVAAIAALEARRPSAVIGVVADEASHEPVFEDPDLSFPYATLPASLAGGLVRGAQVTLEVNSEILVGEGVNLSAGPTTGRRIVVCAHVDSKITTPGALDNGGGVAALLALAEAGLDELGRVELVFFNGELHYAAPGEQAWLAAGGVDDVELVINIDGAGLDGYGTAVSTLAADQRLEDAVAHALAAVHGARAGEPWFEGDHAVFAMRGIPTVAITTNAPFDLLKRVSHAADDGPERIDERQLADVVAVVRSLLAAYSEAGITIAG